MSRFSTFAALIGLLLAAKSLQAQSFASAIAYSAGTGGSAIDLAVADVNADGKPDIVVTKATGNTVSMLLGTSTGAFQAATPVSTGNNSDPYGIAVADVNSDGRPDVLVANTEGHAVGVLLASGAGAFQAVATYTTGLGSTPHDIAVADLNGDGKLDLCTANTGNDKVSVLLGMGTGTFQPAVSYSVGSGAGPIAVVVADMNADGKPDVLTANATSVGILLGTGSGSLQPVLIYPTNVSASTRNLAVADVNGDGRPDVVTANPTSNTVSVLLGTNNGALQTATDISTGTASNPRDIVVADMNADNKPDLLVTCYTAGSIRLMPGNGDGTFQPGTTYPTGAGSFPFSLAVADVNNDNRRDLLVTNSANVVSVLLNTTPLPTRGALPGATASLAPNPAGAATTLHVAGLPNAVAQVQATVLDATGREVVRHRLPARAGSIHAELPTAGLAPDLYVVRLLGYDEQGALAGEVATQRLKVQ